MECDKLIDLILVIGRVSVLIIGMFAGIFTVYLGWRLYKDAVISRTSGEVTYKSIKIVLTSGGPGVFLAIFGAYILITILSQRIELSNEEPIARLDGPQWLTPTAPYLSLATHHNINAARGIELISPAIATRPDPCQCAIRKSNRKLFRGGTPPTSADIRDAIDLALHDLDLRESGEQVQKAEYRKAIMTLTDMRKNIVE